jgi:hypothetical protein
MLVNNKHLLIMSLNKWDIICEVDCTGLGYDQSELL